MPESFLLAAERGMRLAIAGSSHQADHDSMASLSAMVIRSWSVAELRFKLIHGVPGQCLVNEMIRFSPFNEDHDGYVVLPDEAAMQNLPSKAP